jgi:hypothetical protein
LASRDAFHAFDRATWARSTSSSILRVGMPSPSSGLTYLLTPTMPADAAVDLALEVVGGARDLALRIALLDRLDDAAHGVDLLDVGPGCGLDLIGQGLDEVAAAQGVGDRRHPGLLEDDLLGAQRELGRGLGRQGVGLVVAVGVQALGAAQDRRQGLHRRPHDVVEWLLGHERDARGLGVGAQDPRPRVLGAEPVADDLGPHPPAGPELGDLLEEVVVHVPEERQPRRELVDRQAGVDAELEVADAVGQGEGQLLDPGRPGLTDVVAR